MIVLHRCTPSSLPGYGVRWCGIYAIRNTVSRRLYIGSSDHIARRWVAHLSQLRRRVHHSFILQAAWLKRGEQAFEFILLELCEREQLLQRETSHIEQLKPQYNSPSPVVGNPMAGRKHTAESRALMSKNRKGKGRCRRVFSAKTREAMSLAAKARDPETRRTPRCAEARQRQSEAMKALYAAGYPHPRIRPVEFRGERFKSGKAAAAKFGLSHSLLIKRLKGGEGRYLD